MTFTILDSNVSYNLDTVITIWTIIQESDRIAYTTDVKSFDSEMSAFYKSTFQYGIYFWNRFIWRKNLNCTAYRNSSHSVRLVNANWTARKVRWNTTWEAEPFKVGGCRRHTLHMDDSPCLTLPTTCKIAVLNSSKQMSQRKSDLQPSLPVLWCCRYSILGGSECAATRAYNLKLIMPRLFQINSVKLKQALEPHSIHELIPIILKGTVISPRITS